MGDCASRPPSECETVKIHVTSPGSLQPEELWVASHRSVAQLKPAVAGRLGMPLERLQLCAEGRVLSDMETVAFLPFRETPNGYVAHLAVFEDGKPCSADAAGRSRRGGSFAAARAAAATTPQHHRCGGSRSAYGGGGLTPPKTLNNLCEENEQDGDSVARPGTAGGATAFRFLTHTEYREKLEKGPDHRWCPHKFLAAEEHTRLPSTSASTEAGTAEYDGAPSDLGAADSYQGAWNDELDLVAEGMSPRPVPKHIGASKVDDAARPPHSLNILGWELVNQRRAEELASQQQF